MIKVQIARVTGDKVESAGQLAGSLYFDDIVARVYRSDSQAAVDWEQVITLILALLKAFGLLSRLGRPRDVLNQPIEFNIYQNGGS